MNLRRVDLNLLVILQALVDERNVSRAAGRLGMSQSAVSHALRRLRALCGDELLVRNGDKMELTTYAVRLGMSIRGALAHIESALDGDRDFDHKSAQRTFYLGISDYSSVYLLPRLIERLRNEAPKASLKVETLSSSKLSDALMFEGVQVRLSFHDSAFPRMASHRLLTDSFVVLMRRGHPSESKIFDLNVYLSQDHLKVTGVGSSIIDETLSKEGLARRVMVEVPSWSEMLDVLHSTDLVAAVPYHWVHQAGFSKTLIHRELPIDNLALTLDSHWHSRNNDDPGHIWFRELISSTYELAIFHKVHRPQ